MDYGVQEGTSLVANWGSIAVPLPGPATELVKSISRFNSLPSLPSRLSRHRQEQLSQSSARLVI